MRIAGVDEAGRAQGMIPLKDDRREHYVHGNLTIHEMDTLSLLNSVTTAGGDIDIVVGQNASGVLVGSGVVNASTGNVTLTNENGSITLTSSVGQVRGNLLTTTSSGATFVNTDVTEISAAVSGLDSVSQSPRRTR